MTEPLSRSDAPSSDVHAEPVPGRVGHWLMMGCCLAMVAGVGIVVLGSWRATGSVDWTGAVLPLLVCVGAHLLMMGVWGRSCHSTASEDAAEEPERRSPPATGEAPGSTSGPAALAAEPR